MEGGGVAGRNAVKSAALLVCCLILGWVFAWAGITKLLNPEGFALAVYRYHLLPGALVNSVSIWLPAVEILCAVLLFIPKFHRTALGMLLALLLVFSMAAAVSLLRGNAMACGCFSTSFAADSMGWTGILRNLGLMVLTLVSLRLEVQEVYLGGGNAR